jgi:hypothetical protein
MTSKVDKLTAVTLDLLCIILVSGLPFTHAAAQAPNTNSELQNKQINDENFAGKIELSKEHIDAVNRRRRIVLQYDAFQDVGGDFKKYITETFESVDRPGSQIDAIWWDIGAYSDMADWPNSSYQNLIGGLPFVEPRLKKWWDQGIDWIAELVRESGKRKLEVFWNHRITEVFSSGTWSFSTRMDNPLLKSHPDWFVRSWYDQGLWNLASPEVRLYKVAFLKELLERYELDGIQLDFARHVPCLPVGRQWELRDNVTEFVRMVRLMMLEMEKKKGRPLLLAAKVPQNPEGCRADGFDVETWAKLNLVDIFTLGTRSIDVDIASFRRITAGHNIKLQPCWDDHHSSDAYRCPPVETYRGIFGNWWQQGADGIVIFNWFVDRGKTYNGTGIVDMASEGGSPETLYLKDKTFILERRGGYPWSEGFFGRNDFAPLPVTLANDGRPAVLMMKVSDNLRADYDKVKKVTLRAVIFGAKEGDEIGARFNGVNLPATLQDFSWKDNQILSPDPQGPSGGAMPPDLPIDPKQKLLRLEYNVNPGMCQVNENQVEIYIINRAPYGHGSTLYNIVLEKLELNVKYN